MIVYSKQPTQNKKLAKVENGVTQWPFVYASYREVGATCPLRCGFHPDHPDAKVHGRRCYATNGNVGLHQRRATPSPEDGDTIYRWVQSLPPGSGVRLHVSGDVYKGGEFDADYFARLCEAFEARPDVRGWMYTHAPLAEFVDMQNAAPSNLAVNWSCDSLDDVARAKSRGVVATTVVLTLDEARTRIKGVTVCPEQTSGIPCAVCKLCWKPNRKTTIGFIVH
jgi:hypothetical protein